MSVAMTGSKSAVSAPLSVRDQIVGVLTLVHPDSGFFNEDHLAIGTGLQGRSVNAHLRFTGAGDGGLQIPLAPSLESEGFVNEGSFLLPDRFGSGYWEMGPAGLRLDPQQHCRFVARKLDLRAGVLEGFVLDPDREPVTDTVVSIPDLGMQTRPDGPGFYKFDVIPWSEDGSTVLTVEASQTRSGLRFAPVTVATQTGRARVDLVATAAPRAPWFVDHRVSDSAPAAGEEVAFEVVIHDDDPGIRWSAMPSVGELKDVSASEVDTGSVWELVIEGTWQVAESHPRAHLAVTATDVDGRTAELRLDTSWGNGAPVVSLKGPTWVVAGESASLFARTDDPNGDDLTRTWHYNGVLTSAADLLEIASVPAGPNYVTLTVSDGQTTVERLHTLIGTDAPGLDAWPETRITSGPAFETSTETVQIGFTSDDSHDHFECALDGVAWQTCTSPVSFGPLAPGLHTVLVRAVNDLGAHDPSPAYSTWRVLP